MVKRIFRSFAFDGKGEVQIAKELNDEGHLNQYGRRWNRNTISNILSNEKYVGHNVYNRTSQKLTGKSVRNPPAMWIKSANAFEAVVDPELFLAAQRKMEELTNRKSNQRMLDNLSALLISKGRLTSKLIDGAESLPCAGSYHQRFGSLLKAYELVGYQPKHIIAFAARQESRRKRRRILSEIFADFEGSSLTVRFDWATKSYVINDKLTFVIYVLRCFKTNCGTPYWILRQRRKSGTNLIIGVRLDTANENVRDYLLLRTAGMSDQPRDLSISVACLGATSIESMSDLTNAVCGAALAT